MEVNRREFIILGAAGAVAACGSKTASLTSAGSGLSIDFVGLCGVVVSGSPSKLEVLLVDGVQTLGAGHEHFPRFWAPSNRVAAESTPPSGTEKEFSFWDLKDHRIRLTSGDTTGVTRVTGVRNPSHKKPDPNEQDDVSWVAGMARIAAAGSGTINPVCLADDPRPGKIAASARFTGGKLKARFTAPFHQVSWRVSSPGEPTPFEQALGELGLSQPLSSGTVTFALEPFGGGAARQIVLHPQGNNLDVKIKNLPKEVKCSKDEDAQKLLHFAAFYQLLATPSSSSPVPICADTPCQVHCKGPQEDEPIYCPPTEFQG
jgi:hypothetical protein